MAKKKPAVVSLDEDQLQWLEKKVEEEGYSKEGLVRIAIKRLMEDHATGKAQQTDTKTVPTSQQSNAIDEEPPKIEFDKLLEIIIKMGDEGKLDELGPKLPEMMESARHIQQRLKNIDSMSPRAAFELGVFKAETEFKVGYAMKTGSNYTKKTTTKGRSWAEKYERIRSFRCYTI